MISDAPYHILCESSDVRPPIFNHFICGRKRPKRFSTSPNVFSRSNEVDSHNVWKCNPSTPSGNFFTQQVGYNAHPRTGRTRIIQFRFHIRIFRINA